MRTWTADSDGGDPGEAWALISEPGRWHEWAPHLFGAWGLGPRVHEGDAGAARLLGAVPVPVRITRVEAPLVWTWRVGALVEMDHRVVARPDGVTVALDLRAPAPLEAGLALAYGPVIALSLRRLANAC